MLLNSLLMLSAVVSATASDIFARPVITRMYQAHNYTLAGRPRSEGDRVDVAQVASAIAGLKPSYVNGLIYLAFNGSITQDMIDDYNQVRTTVLASSPNAKFDVELSIRPKTQSGKPTYGSGTALVAYMTQVNSVLKIDGWWFDFLSTAQSEEPSWIVAATNYAHGLNQTVGGNVWTSTVPPTVDAIAFVDDPDSSSPFGFGFNASKVKALEGDSKTVKILGHLQCNPQNGPTTESNVYINEWNSTRRYEYLNYWVTAQKKLNFQFMYPLFYPLYPVAYSFDPLNDTVPSKNETLYNIIKQWALGQS